MDEKKLDSVNLNKYIDYIDIFADHDDEELLAKIVLKLAMYETSGKIKDDIKTTSVIGVSNNNLIFETKNRKYRYDAFRGTLYVNDDSIFVPLYSYKTGQIGEKSGINAWNGAPKSSLNKSGRPAYEVYLPVPKELHKKVNGWFGKDTINGDGSSIKFMLHFPDGEVIPGRLAQQGYKSLQTNPQAALGKWLIDNVLKVTKGTLITKTLLDERGVDCVHLWHEDHNDLENIWIDFAATGTFERFMAD